MGPVTVTPMVLPSAWDDDTEAGRAFRESVAFNAAVRAHLYGTADVAPSPAELLGLYRGSDGLGCAGFDARLDGRVVGRALVWLPRRESPTMLEGGWISAPGLPAADGRAVAEALLDAVEAFAVTEGRPWVLLEVPGEPGELVPVSGAGSIDPTEPDAAALLAHGFTLQQVYRYQIAHLDALTGLDADLAAAAVPGYTLVRWVGRVPGEYRDRFCALASTMIDEVPTGGVQFEPEIWDDARLTDLEEMQERAGRTLVGALVLAASGDPAGYTELWAGAGRVASQGDTLVAPAHRGRRLGRWLKLANLAQLRAAFPQIRHVTTDNAEENAAMLAINEAIGFRTAMREGFWERKPEAAASEAAAG